MVLSAQNSTIPPTRSEWNSDIKLDAVPTDKDDNRILEAAVAGKAHIILTYDRHLLQLGSYERIMIITPEEFLS